MTAREFLDQYREADRKAKRLRSEYEKEQLLIDAIRSTSDMDGMPHGSGIRKTVEDKAVRLADKALAYKDAELDAIRIRQIVFDVVCSVPGIEGEILDARYIKLLKWEDVYDDVHISKTSARNHHIKALEIVQAILDVR